MLAKTSAPAGSSTGSLVIVGADPAFRHRLLRSLGAVNHSRPISAVAARPDIRPQIAALLPSVILVDLGAKPNGNALGIVPTLSALARTIVLGHGDDALVIQALKAGASGFCSRDTATALLRKAVQRVEAGEIWVGRRVMRRLIEELRALRAPDAQDLSARERLTARERDIATLVARGASNKEIASQLSISIKTVKTHLTNIFKKLGLETRLQLGLALGRGSAAPTKVG